MTSNEWTFASILDPVDIELFRKDYWSREPLHVPRGNARYYDGLVTLGEIERHLSRPEPFARHSISTPRQGQGVPDPLPTCLNEVYARVLDDSSLRIRKMECFMDPASPLIAVIRDVVLQLQHPLESLSCYIARKGAAGLGPHHDETEIFTLQISGRKRWRLYHRVVAADAATYEAADLGKASRELTLEPGDLLYVPSGLVHDVTAEEGAFSITIVLDPFRWQSLLDVLLDRTSTSGAFLAAIPAGALLRDRGAEALRIELAERLKHARAALDAITVDDLIDHLAERLLATTTWPATMQLASVLGLETMALDTVVERNVDIPWHLARHGNRVRLTLAGGYSVDASARIEPALRSVLTSAKPFSVRDMHDSLGDAAKLVLATKLVGSGLLRPRRSKRP